MIVFEAASLVVTAIDTALWWAATTAGTLAFVAAVCIGTAMLQPPKARRGATVRAVRPLGRPEARSSTEPTEEPHRAA